MFADISTIESMITLRSSVTSHVWRDAKKLWKTVHKCETVIWIVWRHLGTSTLLKITTFLSTSTDFKNVPKLTFIDLFSSITFTWTTILIQESKTRNIKVQLWDTDHIFLDGLGYQSWQKIYLQTFFVSHFRNGVPLVTVGRGNWSQNISLNF